MRRYAIGSAAVVVLLAWWLWPSPPAAPEPDAPGVEEGRPAPVRPRVVLRRPTAEAPRGTPTPIAQVEAAAGEAGAGGEDVEADEDEAWTLDDLPDADRRELGAKAMGNLGELQERCAEAVTEEAFVLLTMTVDAEGLLELEVASYDQESAMIVEGVGLPEALVDCLDEEVWTMDWPTWEAPLSFALTSPF